MNLTRRKPNSRSPAARCCLERPCSADDESAQAPAPTPAPPPKPSAILIENVRIFDGECNRLSALSNVLVVGNKIQAINTTPISPPPNAALTRIDGGGRTLMPGLIDNHVHIPLSAGAQAAVGRPQLRADLEARGAEEAEPMLHARLHLRARHGRAGVRLQGGIDTGKYAGPRIWPSGAMISQTSGHGDSRMPHERSRRFFGEASRGEELGVNFIADGRTRC